MTIQEIVPSSVPLTLPCRAWCVSHEEIDDGVIAHVCLDLGVQMYVRILMTREHFNIEHSQLARGWENIKVTLMWSPGGIAVTGITLLSRGSMDMHYAIAQTPSPV